MMITSLSPLRLGRLLVALLSCGACVLVSDPVSARISPPQELISRPNAHCQNPRWAPNGRKLAVDVYQPRNESHSVFIVNISTSGAAAGEELVRIAGLSQSRLSRQSAPPVLEFAWAPNMDTPYVFSTQGSRRNFDLYADGTWLTTNLGNDGQPAWSPSGRFLAFTSQRADSGDIWYIDFEGDGQPHPLFETVGQTEYLPRFSPRKDQLLFIRSQGERRGQDIVVRDDMSRAGSERLLTDWSGDEIRPSWSPDGRFVAFYSNQRQRDPRRFDLWVISQSGGEATRLAQDVVVDNHYGPAWSRDSAKLIFVKRDFERNNPIMWVARSGGRSGVLATGTQLNSDLSIYHRRGGISRLAFSSVGLESTREKSWRRVYAVDFALSDLN